MAAARGLVAILVDCTDQVPPDMDSKYHVAGFPTVLFTDPSGTKVDEMGDRSAAAIKAQIERVIKEHKRVGFAKMSLPDGVTAAKQANKMLGIMFVDGAMDGYVGFVDGIFNDPKTATLKDRFQWIELPLKDAKKKVTDEAKRFKASKAPFLVLADPRGDDPAQSILGNAASAKGLEGLLKKALEKAEKSPAQPGKGGEPKGEKPAGEPKGEKGEKGEEGEKKDEKGE